MSIFGPIPTADDVESAVLTTLKLWFTTYLIEYQLQAGLMASRDDEQKLLPIKSWLKANQLNKENADQLPSLVVVSPGLSNGVRPKKEGDGSLRVSFTIAIGVFASANNRENTLKLVRIYAAVVRMIMLQKQALGGVSDGVTWVDESYDDNFQFVDNETLSACEVVFEVEVSGFGNARGGPVVPDPTPDLPGSDWPLAETVTATIKRKVP